MDNKEGFKSLIAWQKAYQLALDVYRITKVFPKDELFALTSQLRRAASSVPANIAEGWGRNQKKVFIQFLLIAKGSLSEVETFLLLAKDLGYLTEMDFNKISEQLASISRLILGLIKSQK